MKASTTYFSHGKLQLLHCNKTSIEIIMYKLWMQGVFVTENKSLCREMYNSTLKLDIPISTQG